MTTTPKAKGEVDGHTILKIDCICEPKANCECLILNVLQPECMALGLGSREAVAEL